jgi:hypothetical protein
MTPTPNFASGARAGAEAGDVAASSSSAGPFVLNLCSSTTPMALVQTDLPELKRFTFFVSRRFEEGRERFRLHMGYFATHAEAEEWLGVVREIYPGAWAGEAPGRKIRERAAAAAAAAQHAVGPQTHAAAPQPPARTAAAAAAVRVAPAAGAASSPAPAPQPLRVPVVHAAPPIAHPAAPIAHAGPSIAHGAGQVSPLAPSALSPPPAPLPPAPRASSPARTSPPTAQRATPLAARPPAVARAAATPATPVKPNPAEGGKGAANVRGAAGEVPDAAARAGRQAKPAAKPPVKPVFEDSNVREVLKALGDSSATGETRLMHAPPPPREVAGPVSGSLTDTQVLRLLESRRPQGDAAAAALAEEPDEGGIPLLKPDDTGTRRALHEAVVSNAPVSFAVQLQWSVQPVELDRVPPLAIFSAYTLYTVEGSRDGRKWYGLRLGFFSDAISAKQVAQYVRSEFTSVAVVPVSPQEKARATDDEQAATLAAPVSRRERAEEFKLIDDDSVARSIPQRAAAAPGPSGRRSSRPTQRPAIGRALRQADAAATPARPQPSGKAGARDRRGPHSLEETLEILGASELSIDTGSGATINDSGVRHLRVQVHKNSPFTRLLERLSERMRKQ